MLTKDFERVYIPGSPGSPEVPARPEYTVCQTSPDEGRWVYSCSRMNIPPNGGVAIPPGGEVVTVLNAAGEVVDVYIRICTSKWVTMPGTGKTTCTTFPATPGSPAVPSVPARVNMQAVNGWNGGANSIGIIDGGCQVKFTMGLVVGVYIGLTTDRESVPEYERLNHALFFHQRNGRPIFRVAEAGMARSANRPYTAGDEFIVRRVNGKVIYLHNGEVIQTAADTLEGPVSVGSALYASGDSIA